MHRPEHGTLRVLLAFAAILLISACNGNSSDSAAAASGASTTAAAGAAESENMCDAGNPTQKDDPCIISSAEQLQELSSEARRYYGAGR